MYHSKRTSEHCTPVTASENNAFAYRYMKRGFVIACGIVALTLCCVLAIRALRMRPLCPGCDVMVISLDQVRAKSLPCFGHFQNTMPSLCDFAGKSTVFTRAYATASRTQDSHFSMMTGLYPSSHTMNLPYASVLPEGVVTLASVMKENGYRTHFLGPANDPHLPLTRGMGRGFMNTYAADDPESWITTLASIKKEATNSGSPAFYFMHTYMAHEPYMPKEEHIRRFYQGAVTSRLSYDDLCMLTYQKLVSLRPEAIQIGGGEGSLCDRLFRYQENASSVAEFDDVYSIIVDEYWHQFADLVPEEKARYLHALYAASLYELDLSLKNFIAYLEHNGFLQNTVVVLVGDQGDEFFEHNGYSHGGTLYDEVLKVPFIIYVPGTKASTSSRLVSLIDIMPTVSKITGVISPRSISGLDAFGTVRHAVILAEHVSDGVTAIITGRWKLIENRGEDGTEYELYDLFGDPGEKQNKVSAAPRIIRAILAEYKRISKALPSYPAGKQPLPEWIGEEDRKTLIESGYF